MKLSNLVVNKLSQGMVLTVALAFSSMSYAAAPVEDLTQGGGQAMGPATEQATTYPLDSGASSVGFSNSAPAPTSADSGGAILGGGSDSQRMGRMEQQLSNLVNMNLPQQVADLQQQVQQLNGKVQEQEHTIKTLSEQQMSFYKDLDQRIGQAQGQPAKPATAVAPVATDNAEQSTASKEAAPMSANDKAQESQQYQAAVNYLMKKDYSKAGSGFKSYLAHYPSGTYTGSAYYWLGEVNLNNNNLKQAAENFQTVIKKFPKSDKFDDAKLKLAMVHAQQGNTALARQELKRIKSDHPGSTMAQLASIQLQQLESGAN